MCYDIQVSSRRQVKAAKRSGVALDKVNRLISERNQQFGDDTLPHLHWHVSGFAHPALPIVVNEGDSFHMDAMRWGLIPRWCKDMPTALKMSNQCLNARSETMFDKPAFRTVSRGNRAVIVVDSFFEHHHFMGKTYPFNIRRKDGDPLLIGALWDEWTDRTMGEVLRTFTLVTVEGNAMMAAIHNNPKLEGPRMPFMLEDDALDAWMDVNTDKADILHICRPLDDGLLTAHTVRPLRGKAATGNGPTAVERYDYPELALDTDLGHLL